jgi:hypothetical protein
MISISVSKYKGRTVKVNDLGMKFMRGGRTKTFSPKGYVIDWATRTGVIQSEPKNEQFSIIWEGNNGVEQVPMKFVDIQP